MSTTRIDIDMDKRCKRCKKKGAGPGGYCLECINKMIQEGKFDQIFEHTLEKNRRNDEKQR